MNYNFFILPDRGLHCSDKYLAQGYAAVAGGDLLREKDLETGRGQAGIGQAEEQGVLETAAAEDDLRKAHGLGDFDGHFGQGVMESKADFAYWFAGRYIGEYLADHWLPIGDQNTVFHSRQRHPTCPHPRPLSQWERGVFYRHIAAIRDEFQRHGGLAFEGDEAVFGKQSHNRCNGVEKPAKAARARAVRAAAEHL